MNEKFGPNLCCLIDTYLKCKWCDIKLCDSCARKPIDMTCKKSPYASNRHHFAGNRIIRSMPFV